MYFTSIFQHNQYVEKLTVAVCFQGKESFEQEETEKATESQVKSQIKNKGKQQITSCRSNEVILLL